jgi:hypothetical protein
VRTLRALGIGSGIALAVVAVLAGCGALLEVGDEAGPAVVDAAMAADAAVDTEPPDRPDDPPVDASLVDATLIPDGGKIVFVTSKGHGGNFGGPDGVDTFCKNVASTSIFANRSFIAYLSRANALTPGGRWYRPDGRLAFDHAPTDLDTPLAPINVTEQGGNPTTNVVWTGFGPLNGDNQRCNGWDRGDTRGGTGDSRSTDGRKWLFSDVDGCRSNNRVYCFEQ